MKTFKNVDVIGWTKKNLSAVIRIGMLDYGDYRFGVNYAISQTGDIYRPIQFNEEFFTKETLPEAAKWVLTKEQVYNEKSLKIIQTINNEYSTQSGSLNSFIRIKFEYEKLIHGTSTHHIQIPDTFDSSYYSMNAAINFFKEKMKLQEELTKSYKRSSELATELITLKEKVFARFYVGKLGKRASTVRNQMKRFLEMI